MTFLAYKFYQPKTYLYYARLRAGLFNSRFLRMEKFPIKSKRASRFLGKPHKIQFFTDYSIIVATRPDPTVLPPSRIRLREYCLANGVFSGFFVIIFSENIVFLCIFKVFVATQFFYSKFLSSNNFNNSSLFIYII